MDPLTLYFVLSYELFQQDKGNDNTIGALVVLSYEFVTFGQNSNLSTVLLLTTGYNINYVFPSYTNNYLQNVWKLGVGIRQSVSQSASIYLTVTWAFGNPTLGWVWKGNDWVPHMSSGFAL